MYMCKLVFVCAYLCSCICVFVCVSSCVSVFAFGCVCVPSFHTCTSSLIVLMREVAYARLNK